MRRLWAGLLLAASFAASSAVHNHADLAGAIQGQLAGNLAERVVSTHSPLSKASHWHSGVVVKEDACLACQSQRFAGVAATPCREAPISVATFDPTVQETSHRSEAPLSNGSRAPPTLL
jgi:hypothetical protein